MRWSKAEASDAEAISALALDTCEQFLFDSMTGEGRDTLRELYKPLSVRQRILANDRFVLLFSDEALVGAAAMRNDNHIYLFFVAGHLHGQGLGRKLMGALVANLGETHHVTLNSSIFAIDFYKHLGFEATGPVSTARGVEFLPMKLVL